VSLIDQGAWHRSVSALQAATAGSTPAWAPRSCPELENTRPEYCERDNRPPIASRGTDQVATTDEPSSVTTPPTVRRRSAHLSRERVARRRLRSEATIGAAPWNPDSRGAYRCQEAASCRARSDERGLACSHAGGGAPVTLDVGRRMLGHRHRLHRRRDRLGPAERLTKILATREDPNVEGDVRRSVRQDRVTSIGRRVTTGAIRVTLGTMRNAGRSHRRSRWG
jgi:hypothetical protein